MFALGKQACSRLRVAGDRFSGPEFGNKRAQPRRGVVGAASGSAAWGWGFFFRDWVCVLCRCLWLLVLFSGLVESFHGAAKRRPPERASVAQPERPGAPSQMKKGAPGVILKTGERSEHRMGERSDGVPPVRPVCGAHQEGVGVAHSAATARPPGWRRRATRSLKAALGATLSE